MSNKSTVITISGNSIDEIKEEIGKLAKLFGLDVVDNQLPLPLPTPSDEAPVATEKKRGARKKAETEPQPEVYSKSPQVAALEEAKAAPEVPAANPPSAVTAGDAETLFRQVLTSKGVAVAKPLIESFGVPKFRDLPAEKYGELVAKCKEILA